MRLWLVVLAGCFAPSPPQGAPCSDLQTCPAGLQCSGGQCVKPGTNPIDAPSDGAGTPASCKALHALDPTAKSGTYAIDPDGPGGAAPLSVTCDMLTSGGGWTLVFLAPGDDVMAVPIAYTSATPRLLADASEALLAYRDAENDAAPAATSFALPADWQTDTPFDYADTDAPVMASVDGGPAEMATLRYGSQNFGMSCDGSWAGAAYGRVCVDGTLGPAYSGFATSGIDNCSASNEAFDLTPCSPTRLFSIAVR
ncbi:MAG TPA: fibrinogen-like YCDxxxxGGGW domain-containing protein [Kofleriaceae bacterium]|nr:fibrinogen-like YCDxxxxGGGW domain-containing protein [Kofleriaceae bacterium]